MLKLLLQWERNYVASSVSSCAMGQLTSVMRYLRTPLKSDGVTSRLKVTSRILRELEQEENQRCRNARVADAVIRRRVLEAKAAYQGTIEIAT